MIKRTQPYKHPVLEAARQQSDDTQYGYAIAPLMINTSDIIVGAADTLEEVSKAIAGKALALAVCRPNGSLIWSSVDVEDVGIIESSSPTNDQNLKAQDYQQRRANIISTLHDEMQWVFCYRYDNPEFDISEDCAFSYSTQDSLRKALQKKVALLGTHSFAVSFAGRPIPVEYVL